MCAGFPRGPALRHERALTDIDLQAFAVYAAYCDDTVDGERRHVLNYVLDREQRAQAVLLEMMGGSRAILLKTGGLWTPRPTRNDTPVRLLSWTAVSNVTLTYLRDVDDINVMEARYSNEDQDFEQDVMTWPSVDNWPPVVHRQSLDLRGVTKPSRVQRALQLNSTGAARKTLCWKWTVAQRPSSCRCMTSFRFSHPLPGWGTSGRIQPGSTVSVLNLDEEILLESGIAYIVYVRHEDEGTDVRAVVPITLGLVRQVTLVSPLSYTPVPRTSVWVFGRLDADANMRTFRVTTLTRKSDTTVHLQAIVHNPTIYDEATATALPVITTLWNPLGPPPPILSLIATEVVRIQPSGASLRVVNLSWDVAAVTSAYAPYAGATILRRTVELTGQAGQALAGVGEFGAIQRPQ